MSLVSHSIVPVAEIAGYGLGGAMALAMLERLVPVVPSYALFIFLGTTLAATPADLAWLALAVTLGTAIGGTCWYGLGRLLGAERTEAFVRRFGRYIWLSERLYHSLGQRYQRHYFAATFIGQGVPVVRIYLSLPAGILRVPLLGFVLALTLGSTLWVSAFLLLGYWLRGTGWSPVTATIIAVLALLVIETAIVMACRRIAARRAA
ncbi:MAG: VTT domain-containing protein [Sphingomonas sp.]|uniref:DedA family protein n=1 Tax=Sphingomonas sp. TaxID=28214 RepID=UPI001B0A7970|nr:VTT domain-containing protein [Sphingomonas sp.]MBO9622858.1 VTT domain-containing protein [Sphingomonas sp.]